jgi:hypothetical protein
LQRRIAILLLGIVLLTNLECYQFIKLPVLIEHFKEHKVDNPQMTFWDYWNLHYKGHPKDADYNRDQQLPFQTSDVIQVISASGFILPQIYSFSFSLELINYSISTYYPGFIPEYCSIDIFQPPRG